MLYILKPLYVMKLCEDYFCLGKLDQRLFSRYHGIPGVTTYVIAWMLQRHSMAQSLIGFPSIN